LFVLNRPREARLVTNPYAPTRAPLRPTPPPERGPRYLPFSRWWPVGFGAAAGLVMRLIFWRSPGEAYSAMLASFILGSPLVVGVVTVYLAERDDRRTWMYYFAAPALATVLYVAGTLALLIEGVICAIVIVPVFALVGGLAGLVMGAICRMTNWPRGTFAGCVALLPLLGGSFEHRIPTAQRVRTQEREVFIAAPPAEVWRALMDTRDIRSEEVDGAWMYRIGVPTPREGVSELRDGERLRHIIMHKGVHFDQVAVEWQENRRVTWQYRFTADSFPAGALDDHARIGGQYFDVRESTSELIPVPGGTRLRLRMSYRVSTHFNWYAGPVADFLVGDFAEVILDFYARRAAAPAQAGSSQPGSS
jgi:hypothetical protein